MNQLILLLFLFFIFSYVFSPDPIPLPHRQSLSKLKDSKFENIDLNWIDLPKMVLFGSGLVSLFWFSLLYSCNQVKYIAFNTNLTLFKKNSYIKSPKLWSYLSIVLLWMLFIEYPEDLSILYFLHYFPSLAFLLKLHPNIYKRLARSCFHTICVFIFIEAVSPATLILSIFVFQIWCHELSSNVPRWLPFILILLANDIELNPGPPLQNQFLSFMNWNLNSLVKENLNVLTLLKPIMPFLIMT